MGPVRALQTFEVALFSREDVRSVALAPGYEACLAQFWR